MYEIEIIYNAIHEHDFIYGYSVKNACERRKIDLSTITVVSVDYID